MHEDLYKKDSVRTYSGQYVNLIKPDLDSIVITDIAVGHSREPRFSGQTRKPYVVGEHVIRGIPLCPTPETKAYFLLHDGSEYLFRDIPSPLKALLPDYKKMEKAFQCDIYTRFGLNPHEIPPVVKEIDEMLKMLEWRVFMLGEKLPNFSSDVLSEQEVYQQFMNIFNELVRDNHLKP